MYRSKSMQSIIANNIYIVNPKIKKLYDVGYTLVEIAEKFNTSTPVVKRALQLCGVETFERRGRYKKVGSSKKVSSRNKVILGLFHTHKMDITAIAHVLNVTNHVVKNVICKDKQKTLSKRFNGG
tara:strand:- start:288 stop:662 length:375 start_codon:yes stop_codon:yes gene_type:complete